MCRSHGWIALAALTFLSLSIPTSQAAIEVTNEQLREGLVSLVHSYSNLDGKLERHEQRERALGDIIKRGLQNLARGQKIFEPIRGSLTRLDERISQLETAILNQDAKVFEQQQKYEKVIDSIERWLSTNGGADSNRLLEEIAINVKALRKDVNDVESQRNSDASTQRLDALFNGFEDKLKQFYVTSAIGAPPTQATHDSRWEEQTSNDLLDIRQRIDAIKCSTTSSEAIDKEFLIGINNQTMDAIADMRHEVLTASDKNILKTTGNIKEISKSINELVSSKSDGETTSADSFCETVTTDVRDVKKSLNELTKLEQMLAQMGDNVLSVKRGMEWNVHAVTIGVSEAIESNSKQLNKTITDNFDDINKTILKNHNGALNNLTSKIETEISQVWRQIGIMYKEVSSSKDALTKLQELTEVYVNGTFVTMDSMKGKVSQITGRMSEVDSNLNYLLGRLSLVTHEFNEIKTGLGSALDNIRSSFQVVQNKIQAAGPGPHKIDDVGVTKLGEVDGTEVDYKLLEQRDAPETANNVPVAN